MRKFFLVFLILFASINFSYGEEPPSSILENAIKSNITSQNGGHNFTYIFEKKEVTNRYTLKKNGETIYCYDVECRYYINELEKQRYSNDIKAYLDSNRKIQFRSVKKKDTKPSPRFKYNGIIELVKRGNKWYIY